MQWLTLNIYKEINQSFINPSSIQKTKYNYASIRSWEAKAHPTEQRYPKGPSIKYVILERGGVQGGVAGVQEHLMSHF